MDQARLTILCITQDPGLVGTVTAALSALVDAPNLITVASLDRVLPHLQQGIDAILVDAALCPADATLRGLKTQAASIPVIVMINSAEDAARRHAFEREANGVVQRSHAAAQLYRAIRQTTTKRSLMQGVAEQIASAARTAAPVGEAAFDAEDSLRCIVAQSSLTVERLSVSLGLDQPTADANGNGAGGVGGPLKFLRGLELSSAVPSNGSSRTYRTACGLNCGLHFCGLSVTVRDGHLVKIEAADFPDPHYRRICLKGISYVQMAAHPKRLLTPLRRTGPRGSGSFEPTGWDDALDAIAAKMRRLSADYGPESLMFFSSSGQLSALNGYNGIYSRLASLLGASAPDISQFGLDSAVPSGIEDTFGAGSGYLANDYADLPNSRLVLLWGANPVYSRMNWWRFFSEAQHGGTRLISIDPRFTATANKSDEWLPIQPGTDLYLALALLREIIVHDWIDRQFVICHTAAPLLVRLDDGCYLRTETGQFLVWDDATGRPAEPGQAITPALDGQMTVNGVACRPAYALLCDMAEPYTLDMAAAKTGLSAQRIADLARAYATTRPARIYTLYGIDRWHHGATFGRLIGTLAALTGNVGVPGGGAGVDGFGEFPTFSNAFTTPEGKHYHPVNPAMLPAQILSEQPNPIKMVWVAFGNWLNQWPDQTRLRNEILPQLDLFVVADVFMTETARYADYVLPVTTIFEREDMVNGPTPYVQYQPAILPPPGECRSDFDIVRALAERLDLGHYFAGQPADYLAEIMAKSRGENGLPLSFDDLRREGVLARSLSNAHRVAHYDRRFATPTGRIEFYVERLVPYRRALPDYEPPIEADPEGELRERFPLVCITEHSPYRVHSTFVNMPWLREMEREPHALLHPSEASVRQLTNDDLVRVYNERGYVVLRARLDEAVPPGTVYFTQGWQTEDFHAGHPQTLTHDRTNPHNALGPNSSFSDVTVQIERERDDGTA